MTTININDIQENADSIDFDLSPEDLLAIKGGSVSGSLVPTLPHPPFKIFAVRIFAAPPSFLTGAVI